MYDDDTTHDSEGLVFVNRGALNSRCTKASAKIITHAVAHKIVVSHRRTQDYCIMDSLLVSLSVHNTRLIATNCASCENAECAFRPFIPHVLLIKVAYIFEIRTAAIQQHCFNDVFAIRF